MIVAKITQQQATDLMGVEFAKDSFFNPIIDANGNYFISLQELTYCSQEFANTVELIEHKPVINNIL